MSLARHGSGVQQTLAALASQIHPVFMLPPLAASMFGWILAGELYVLVASLHLLATGAAVYTAHVRDGYIDFYVRDEDEDHPLTPQGCRVGIWLAGTVFWSATIGLWWFVDVWAVLLTVPGWLIGYAHAPYLDMTTVGETLGYPTGIALALLGGFYVQTAGITIVVLSFAGVLWLLLAGVKIIDDEQDTLTDRQLGKPSVPAVIGRERARQLAVACIGLSLSGVFFLAVVGVFPRSAVAAAVAFLPVAAIGVRADPATATAMLIRGCYVFLAVLVAVMWWT